MKRILTIIGARPQIIKAAALSRAIKSHFSDKLSEDLLHTGQHYDANMSDIFFNELGIPAPKYQLSVGSGSHGAQTAAMIEGIEKVLLDHSYDAVVVYGDTNSTLAGAVAASKLHVPLIHIEAGLRSFNKRMPEEINRIACDHMSTLLFSPTETGIENLKNEGLSHHVKPWSMDRPGVFHCGDVMYDNSLYFSKAASTNTGILEKLSLTEQAFGLSTIHRDTNTDNTENLASIIEGLLQISEISQMPIVLPIHPRTSSKLSPQLRERLESSNKLIVTPPLSFVEMVRLESSCAHVITDSGGVQKEAYFFKKPCVILREQTEWVELVSNGNAILAGSSAAKMVSAFQQLEKERSTMTWPNFFGDANSAAFICSTISDYLEA